MYRTLFPLLLCLNAATPAPQSNPDSDVNFVKIQPVLEDIAPEVTDKRRESRVALPLVISENIDGTVPGILADGKSTYDTPDVTESNGKPTEDILTNGKPTEDTVSDGKLTNAKPTDATVSDEVLPDLSVQNTELSEQKTSESEVETEKSDILRQETQSRQGRNYHSSDETTESFEIATEKYEEVTEIVAKKPPKFTPKTSYFPKNNERFSTNLIEKSFYHYRQFRSRCRCEKIWNCPKLQITVPRCPDEYFLCCF